MTVRTATDAEIIDFALGTDVPCPSCGATWATVQINGRKAHELLHEEDCWIVRLSHPERGEFIEDEVLEHYGL